MQEAVTQASKGHQDPELADEQQPYLVLRVSGRSASWLMKTQQHTKKLGTTLKDDSP